MSVCSAGSGRSAHRFVCERAAKLFEQTLFSRT